MAAAEVQEEALAYQCFVTTRGHLNIMQIKGEPDIEANRLLTRYVAEPLNTLAEDTNCPARIRFYGDIQDYPRSIKSSVRKGCFLLYIINLALK